jgi:hypothetical protein
MPKRPRDARPDFDRIRTTPAAPVEEASRALEEESRRAERAKQRQKVAQERHAQEQRTRYTPKLFAIATLWLVWIACIVSFQGFGGVFGYAFALDSGVLIALISGTSVAVLGVLLAVVNYIFPKSSHAPWWRRLLGG